MMKNLENYFPNFKLFKKVLEKICCKRKYPANNIIQN